MGQDFGEQILTRRRCAEAAARAAGKTKLPIPRVDHGVAVVDARARVAARWTRWVMVRWCSQPDPQPAG
jgi:hypothetical protein